MPKFIVLAHYAWFCQWVEKHHLNPADFRRSDNRFNVMGANRAFPCLIQEDFLEWGNPTLDQQHDRKAAISYCATRFSTVEHITMDELPDLLKPEPAHQGMTEERALELNAQCVRLATYHILEHEVEPLAPEVTLSDLLEAKRIVKAINDRVELEPYPHSLHIFCDDRILAAIYVAHRFQPEPLTNPEPIFWTPDQKFVLLVSPNAGGQS